MPAVEYACRNCHQNFTVNLSLQDKDSESVRCPNCKSTKVEKVMIPVVE